MKKLLLIFCLTFSLIVNAADLNNEITISIGKGYATGYTGHQQFLRPDFGFDNSVRYIRLLRDNWGVGGEIGFVNFQSEIKHDDYPIRLKTEDNKAFIRDNMLAFRVIGQKDFQFSYFKFGISTIAGFKYAVNLRSERDFYFKSADSPATIKQTIEGVRKNAFGAEVGVLVRYMFFPGKQCGIGIETGYIHSFMNLDKVVHTTNCFQPEITYPDQIIHMHSFFSLPVRICVQILMR